jgi:hypothetical protein
MLETVIGDDAVERQAGNYPLAVNVKISEVDADSDGSIDDVRISLNVVDPAGYDFTADILTFFFDVQGNPTTGSLQLANPTDKAVELTTTGGRTLEGGTQHGNNYVFDYAVQTGDAGGVKNNGATFDMLNFDIGLLELQNIGVRAQSISSTPPLTGSDSQKLTGILPECPKFGEVEVIKHHDLTGNGASAGDPILTTTPFSFTLRYTFEGQEHVVQKDTDATGKALFTDIPVGATYTVTEDGETGWYQTGVVNDGDGGVIDAAGDKDTYTFYNTQKGEIVGEKYEDSNGNLTGGTLSAVPGWTIKLYEDAGGGALGALVDETATGSDGSYSFTDIRLGNYVVVEEMQSGWFNVDPAGAEPVKRLVTLDESGETYGDDHGEHTDFINARYGSIEGKKIIDADGNLETTDDRSAGIGWTIKLYKDNDNDATVSDGDNLIDTTTTGAGGTYSFANLLMGNYVVTEEVQDGFINISPIFVDADSHSSGQVVSHVNFINSPEKGGEGLTPGFWHREGNWSKIEIDPACADSWEDFFSMSFADAFNVVGSTTFRAGRNVTTFDAVNNDLHDAVNFNPAGGGDLAQVIRHGAAALANACTAEGELDYRLTEDQVITLVQTAWNDPNGTGLDTDPSDGLLTNAKYAHLVLATENEKGTYEEQMTALGVSVLANGDYMLT